MAFAIKRDLLTNKQYGDYGGRPVGTIRRIDPTILICIHVTGGMSDAQHQRDYANSHDGGPSAHDYINRDGSVVHAIDPTYAAWSNGAVNGYEPTYARFIVAKVRDAIRHGYNANELYYREVECVGDAAHPVSHEQKLTIAEMIALDSRETGIPISSATVGLHRDLNTVNRSNCPFSADPYGQRNAIIRAALAIYALG